MYKYKYITVYSYIFNIYNIYIYMSLSEIVDSTLTDKNTTHSYLELYEKLLNSKKEKVTCLVFFFFSLVPSFDTI